MMTRHLWTFLTWTGYDTKFQIYNKNKPEILSAIKARVKFFNTSSFPIIRFSNKLFKVQVTQGIQSPSFPKCPKPKSPKAQVTQCTSHPRSKFHKLPLSKEYVWFSHGQEYWRPCNSQKYFWLSHDKKKSKLPKVYKVQVTQGIQSPSFPKCPKSPKAQVSQSPSYPRCPKSKSPKVSKVQVAQSPNYPKPKLPEVQVAPK